MIYLYHVGTVQTVSTRQQQLKWKALVRSSHDGEVFEDHNREAMQYLHKRLHKNWAHVSRGAVRTWLSVFPEPAPQALEKLLLLWLLLLLLLQILLLRLLSQNFFPRANKELQQLPSKFAGGWCPAQLKSQICLRASIVEILQDRV